MIDGFFAIKYGLHSGRHAQCTAPYEVQLLDGKCASAAFRREYGYDDRRSCEDLSQTGFTGELCVYDNPIVLRNFFDDLFCTIPQEFI